MTEQAAVQETVQPDAEDIAAEIESASTASDANPASISSAPSTVIAEARRYRKRAQAAEKAVEELKSDLAERQKKLSEHEQTIAALRSRQKIDELLLSAGAIDLEAARVLAQAELAKDGQPSDSDIEQAVGELRRRKPFLFRTRATHAGGGGALSPKGQEISPQQNALTQAATEAGSTGKRGDVLRYLRLRRGNA